MATTKTLPSYLSHSTASMAGECPKKLQLKKGLGCTPVVSKPQWASVGGTAAHAAIQLWDENDSPDWREAYVASVANESLLSAADEAETKSGVSRDVWRVSARGKETGEWWAAELPAMVQRYIDWRRANPNLEIWRTPEGAPAIELRIMIDLPPLQVPFLCFIDRVFWDSEREALIIWDAKFGAMKPKDLSQLARYARAFEACYGLSCNLGAVYDGRKGELIPIIKGAPEIAPLAQLTAGIVGQNLADIWTLMNSGVYPAHPSDKCGWCDVRHACAWANGDDAWKLDPAHPAYTLAS